NLPKVPQAKVEKLTAVVSKLVSRIGTLVTHEESGYNGIYMPFENDSTLGMVFVEYANVGEAQKAIQVLQGYTFDKHHSFNVVMYDRAQKLQRIVTSEFKKPEMPPFVE